MTDEHGRTHPQEGSIRLFVYGTLKRGGVRHELIAPYVVRIEDARVQARLYRVSAGYPALEMPEEAILARGSADPIADAATANSVTVERLHPAPPEGTWVLGEVATLLNPAECVPHIDEYEGFWPGEACLYQRVLVAVEVNGKARTAWTYARAAGPHDVRIESGVWKP